jgi:hypothetical protein
LRATRMMKLAARLIGPLRPVSPVVAPLR